MTSARSSGSVVSGSSGAVASTRCRVSASRAPDSPAKFPIVKATVKLNAYAFSAPVPTTPDTRIRPPLPTRPRWDCRGRSDPLMAKRNAQETAAAKAKKQKMILIVGGVLLLAVAAFQVPKMMKGGGSAAAPALRPLLLWPGACGQCHFRAFVAVDCSSDQGLRRHRRRRSAKGVRSSRLRRASSPRSRSSRSRIHSSRRSATMEAAADRPPAGTGQHHRPTQAPARRARILRSAEPAGTTPAAPPAPILFATIDFNTKPQQVQVKGTFPTPEPLFVLRSLKKKQAKINVAGGSFDGGKPVTLKLGKKVTLVNTATGVRYVLKLDLHGCAARGHRGLHERRRPRP